MYEKFDFKSIKPQQWQHAFVRADVHLQLKQIEQSNNERYRAALSKRDEYVRWCDSVFGARSKEANYARRMVVPKPPKFDKDLKKLDRALEDWHERQRRAEYAREYKQRKTEAVEQLLRMGYMEGVHYPTGHAVSTLNRLLKSDAVEDADYTPVGVLMLESVNSE